MKNYLFTALLPLLFLTASCSQGIPEIHSTIIQLLRVQDSSLSFVERLSVYVFFDDSDGVADFHSITVSNDETGLTWTIPSENSSVRMRGKDRWTGSGSLSGPGDDIIPGGAYTLTVSDLAGNEAVSSFALERPDFPERAPVSFSVKGDTWTLVRNDKAPLFTRTFLLLYDSEGTLLYSWLVPDSSRPRIEGTVATLRAMANKAVSVRCLTENNSSTGGVLLTPFDIR